MGGHGYTGNADDDTALCSTCPGLIFIFVLSLLVH